MNASDEVVASAERDPLNGLYSFTPIACALSADHMDTTKLWHRHMGHLKYTNLQFLSRSEKVIGLPHINH